MQPVIKSSSPSSFSSSQSAGGRPDHSSADMEEFQRLHLIRSSPPPSPRFPGPHRKATNKHHPRQGHHHGGHSPPPHHRGPLDVHRLRHDSFLPPPLVGALHCKVDKLRVKNPKPFKKVGKIHRKLIKTYKHHKGTAHLLRIHNGCLAAPHYPGCCLHNPNPNSSMMQDEMSAELEQYPPCHHEAQFGHHGRHGRPHCHGRHYPHVRSVVRCISAPPMSLARHEAKDMQAKPATEAGMLPPVSDNMLLAVERGRAEI